MVISRDSRLLWLGVFGAAITFLIGSGEPPTKWTYQEWLQALGFLVAYLTGMLQTSPLPSQQAATVADAKAKVVDAKRELIKVEAVSEPKVGNHASGS